MLKTQQPWLLDQSARRKRLERVASMADLVEGQARRGPKPKGFVARFWEKVNQGAPGECWEWTGSLQGQGYGRFSICNKYFLAHRISFLIAHQKIDPDLFVMHSCDNPKCVNPSHLSQGTCADNIRDAMIKGRLRGGCGDSPPQGEKNGMARLTQENVLYIREAYASGESMTTLANQFGVWVPCVWRIIRRLRWRHI